jgi:hypothetical protein
MTAQVILFRRPARTDEPVPSIPPPVILSAGRAFGQPAGVLFTYYEFVGTEQQIIAWGIARPEQLLAPGKRVNYGNGIADPSVRKLPGGTLSVVYSDRIHDSEHGLFGMALAERTRAIVARSSAARARLLDACSALHKFRQQIFATAAYDEGLHKPFDAAMRELERVMARIANADGPRPTE